MAKERVGEIFTTCATVKKSEFKEWSEPERHEYAMEVHLDHLQPAFLEQRLSRPEGDEPDKLVDQTQTTSPPPDLFVRDSS